MQLYVYYWKVNIQEGLQLQLRHLFYQNVGQTVLIRVGSIQQIPKIYGIILLVNILKYYVAPYMQGCVIN